MGQLDIVHSMLTTFGHRKDVIYGGIVVVAMPVHGLFAELANAVVSIEDLLRADGFGVDQKGSTFGIVFEGISFALLRFIPSSARGLYFFLMSLTVGIPLFSM